MDVKTNNYPDSVQTKLAACGLLADVDNALRAYRPSKEVWREFRLQEEHEIPYSTFAAHAKDVKDAQKLEDAKLRTETRRFRERVEALAMLRKVLASEDGEPVSLDELADNALLEQFAADETSPKSLKLLSDVVVNLKRAKLIREDTRIKRVDADRAEHQARELEKIGQARGLTPEALAEIKSKVLGL